MADSRDRERFRGVAMVGVMLFVSDALAPQVNIARGAERGSRKFEKAGVLERKSCAEAKMVPICEMGGNASAWF